MSDSDFDALAAALPPAVRGPVRFAFLTGWRLASEVLTLTWDRVDFEASEVRLYTSKNGKPRVFPFALLPELAALLKERQNARAVEGVAGGITNLVFHRNGRPIRDLRGAWEKACQVASLAGLIPHDLRRSAVRRLSGLGFRGPWPCSSPATRRRPSIGATPSWPRATLRPEWRSWPT